jgi:hypothetical protein
VGLQVEQWHVVSPLDQQLVNLWAIVDAHRREDPDFKVRSGTPAADLQKFFWIGFHPLRHHGRRLMYILFKDCSHTGFAQKLAAIPIQ